MGLMIGITFGVATMIQTSVQNMQGTKSYELDLWNTCADHEAIQNTTTCKRVLSQSFDKFQKRGLKGLDPDIALRIQEIIIKRNNPTDGKMFTLNYESEFITNARQRLKLMASTARPLSAGSRNSP
jgi:hypothetical protein